MTTPLFNPYKDMPAPDLTSAFNRFGQALADYGKSRELERAKEEAAAKELEYAKDVQRAFADGRPEAFGMLTLKYPGQREAIKQGWEMADEGTREKEYKEGVSIYSALRNGNVDIAKNMLDTRIEAMTKNGEDASVFSDMRQRLDSDPLTVQSSIGFTLSALDPERWNKVAEASTAMTRKGEELRKLSAETSLKKIEADYAPNKIAAEINLTKAQTGEVGARTEKTKAETDVIKQQADGVKTGLKGLIPLEKRPDFETRLRGEYNDQTKQYKLTNDFYNRITTVQETGAGDTALIFNYMKMLDPTSTVSAGEQASINNAAGVPESIRGLYNRTLSEGFLSAEARKDIINQAKLVNDKANESQNIIRKGIEGIAGRYGLDTQNIFYAAAQPTGGAPVNITLPDGSIVTLPNQEAADTFRREAGIK